MRRIPRPELNTLHHSLRMLATHPQTENVTEIVDLADRLWAESVRRGEDGE